MGLRVRTVKGLYSMREYVRPEFYMTKFEPNEYIAACAGGGDSNPTIDITCAQGGSAKLVLMNYSGGDVLPTTIGAGGGVACGVLNASGTADNGTLFLMPDGKYAFNGAIRDGHYDNPTNHPMYVNGHCGSTSAYPYGVYEVCKVDPSFPNIHHHLSNVTVHNHS